MSGEHCRWRRTKVDPGGRLVVTGVAGVMPRVALSRIGSKGGPAGVLERVVVSGWSVECCGDPFQIGGAVTWETTELLPEQQALYSEFGAPVTRGKEHHGEATGSIPGVVRKIYAVRWRYEERDERVGNCAPCSHADRSYRDNDRAAICFQRWRRECISRRCRDLPVVPGLRGASTSPAGRAVVFGEELTALAGMVRVPGEG
ncbi:DUF6578 domain-containing protein [Microbacterium sp. Leaf320]|uniref:DUF6578 domain-containing protein n=1 Tax=Microbacterium sp. Leaf320 TaxID=1736334 RepID=UPI0039DF6405